MFWRDPHDLTCPLCSIASASLEQASHVTSLASLKRLRSISLMSFNLCSSSLGHGIVMQSLAERVRVSMPGVHIERMF